MGLKAFTKMFSSNMNMAKKDKAKKNYRKIYEEIILTWGGLKLVLDDESHFSLDLNVFDSKRFYHAWENLANKTISTESDCMACNRRGW